MEIIDSYRGMARAEVGGKFASQAAMREAGIPVPEFFCLSKALFDRVVGAHRPAIELILKDLDRNDRRQLAAAAGKIAALVNGAEIDLATVAAILAAFDHRFAREDFVSVRASMVCERAEFSEDSATNPFAGISESYLYVTRERLLEKIKGCWASAFSERALVYRLSLGIDLMDVSVAVGIQRMVFGERSFVMFTCDPNSLARDSVLIAGYGIGEGVVQESVPVDHYFVPCKGQPIRQVIADKQTRLSLDRERGWGLRPYIVPEAERRLPCLAEDEIRRLSELGQRIETLFGAPQDVEGCFTDAGELYFLQARPIAIDYARKRVWTSLNVTESYPGISSPLTYSLARLFYRVIFQDVYRRVGIDQREIHRNYHLFDRMIGYLRGRIYYNLNAFYLLHQQSPLYPKLYKFWEAMIGLPTSYAVRSGEEAADKGRLRKAWELAVASARFAGVFVRHPSRMRAYKDWWITRCRASRELISREDDALVLTEEFKRLWRDVGEHWGVTLVNDAYIFTLYGATLTLFKRWGLNENQALLSNLLCGGEEIESVEIFVSVLKIAEKVRADADLRELFTRLDDAQLTELYRKRLLEPTLMSRIDAHIERYGDRSMEELKMENPSLREDPTVLFAGIRRFARSELKVESFKAAELAKRAEAEELIQAHFAGKPLRRAVLMWLVNQLRGVIAHRENSRYCRSELFGLCKDIFRKLGEALASRGALVDAADVYYLSLDELLGYADGTGLDDRFQDTVARRKAQLAEYAADEIPESLTTDGCVRDNALSRAPEASEDGELRGLGSSMGVARGVARVVHDPNSVGELADGTILVAKETDPGWLFLMLASSGMIVERGSMLSHTAITGRKFGIPTIVGVPAATSRIPDGAAVEMDGGSGVVKLVVNG